MSEMEEQTALSEDGSVRIADEVVAIIAGIAATHVKGVAGMSGGLVGGLGEMLGRRNLQKGVKVTVGEQECSVDLYVMVEYGVRIPEIAQKAQEEVRTAIERMTGLTVREVNVHVQGVAFENREEPEGDKAPRRG